MAPKNTVSIILPYFNNEKTIEDAILSFTTNAGAHDELICVNDGSDDYSEHIVLSYANRDSRIVSRSQENLGPGAARNTGLKIASRNWVGFLDADDLLSEEYFRFGVRLLSNTTANVVVLPVVLKNAIDNSFYLAEWCNAHPQKDKDICTSEISGAIFQKTNPAPWNKLYRRSFLNELIIEFNEELHPIEDLSFTYEAIAKSEIIRFSERGAVIHFWQGGGRSSLIKSSAISTLDALFDLHSRLISQLNVNRNLASSFIKLSSSVLRSNYKSAGMPVRLKILQLISESIIFSIPQKIRFVLICITPQRVIDFGLTFRGS